MLRKTVVLGICAGLFGLLGSVPSAGATDALSDRLVLSCNTDGTYTCGNSCRVPPYNGHGCCEL